MAQITDIPHVEARAQSDFARRCIAVYLVGCDGRQLLNVTNVTVEEVNPFEARAYRHALDLSSEGAQKLMDDLWRAGVRPSDLQMVDGERSALREHIADLRHQSRQLLDVVDRCLPARAVEARP